jgi:hypothetical protein
MRSGRLYEDVCSWDNLLHAFAQAARGKRGQASVAEFELHLGDQLAFLRTELSRLTYRPGPYHSFRVHDPKPRLISAAPFRDRVVHHALVRVIEPLFERRFISDSYANRTGKGTHRAVARCQDFAKKHRYVLTCDVRQHFPSIDHRILVTTLARVISDCQVLCLCERILESGAGVLSGEYEMVYFRGDDLFAALRPRGLPIGNLTSQFWSNCYLDPFDHFVKRELRCRAYLRYVDDFLLFGDNPAELWSWKRAVQERLESFRLTIHDRRSQVQPVSHGIPWLGFVVYPTHRRLRRREVLRYRRRLRRIVDRYHAGTALLEQVGASVRGWVNHVRFADSWGLRRAILGGLSLKNPRIKRPDTPEPPGSSRLNRVAMS